MTAEERIEAAIKALPNAYDGPSNPQNFQRYIKIQNALFGAAPDLAEEVLRLRAELASLRKQVKMLERGVIAMGCSNDQLRAKLAEAEIDLCVAAGRIALSREG